MSNKTRPDHERDVCAILDRQVTTMDSSVEDKLTRMRLKALAVQRPSKSRPLMSTAKYAPVLSVLIFASILFFSQDPTEEAVIVMPISMVLPDSGNNANIPVPTEDIAMLADMEFVLWLASNEAEL